jgi:hypothetical protein
VLEKTAETGHLLDFVGAEVVVDDVPNQLVRVHCSGAGLEEGLQKLFIADFQASSDWSIRARQPPPSLHHI